MRKVVLRAVATIVLEVPWTRLVALSVVLMAMELSGIKTYCQNLDGSKPVTSTVATAAIFRSVSVHDEGFCSRA